MIRRWLDSPVFYFGVAAILIAIGVGTQVVVELPKRPEGDPSQIRSLAERDDLNVVFVVVDDLLRLPVEVLRTQGKYFLVPRRLCHLARDATAVGAPLWCRAVLQCESVVLLHRAALKDADFIQDGSQLAGERRLVFVRCVLRQQRNARINAPLRRMRVDRRG